MADCIFCKIVKGEIPSSKIWEDSGHIAILDIFPNVKGQALVIPKKHLSSYVFDIDDENFTKLLLAAKMAGRLLDKALGAIRTAAVMEGMEVDHAHIKLYPLYHKKTEKFEPVVAPKEVFFEKYAGYVTSLHGPKANIAELNELAEKIRNSK